MLFTTNINYNDFENNNMIIDDTNIYDANKYDKWLTQIRYDNWTSRQLKIEYESNQKFEQFNQFRKQNN